MSMRSFADDPNETEQPPRGDPYRALWASVLTQAMTDAKHGPERIYNPPLAREDYRERSLNHASHFEVEWKSWLGSNDFYKVCDFADIDAEQVLSQLTEESRTSYHKYVNGIEMRFTKVLRERNAARKAEEQQLAAVVEKHLK